MPKEKKMDDNPCPKCGETYREGQQKEDWREEEEHRDD